MCLLQLFFVLTNRALVLSAVIQAVHLYKKEGHRQYIAYVRFYIRLTYEAKYLGYEPIKIIGSISQVFCLIC